MVTLSKVCSSPVRNSSSSPGSAGLGASACSQARSASALVEPVRRLRPAPAGGLATSGKPTSSAKASASVGAGDELVAGARDAGGAQHGLHPGLVPDVERGLLVHARDAERLPDLGQRHLELLQGADQTFDPAHLAAQAGDRLGDLPGVERVVHPPVAGEVLRSSGGRLDEGSVVMSPRRTPGSWAAAATNRVVASSRNGATNAATTMRWDVTGPGQRRRARPARRLGTGSLPGRAGRAASGGPLCCRRAQGRGLACRA